MDQFDQMKVTRQAMNGRMCLMFGGIFLMFSAITSTIMYGINFFMTALEADKGTAEYVELLKNAGVGSGLLKGIGICFIAVGIWEVVVGFLSVRNSNRVDKSRFSVKLALSLLVIEVLMQVILFFSGLMNLGLLFTAIVLPLFLLWGATRLGKVAKADPERKFAVDPAKKKSPQQSKPAAPKKSIRERAAMQARLDEEVLPKEVSEEPEVLDVNKDMEEETVKDEAASADAEEDVAEDGYASGDTEEDADEEESISTEAEVENAADTNDKEA